MSQDLNPERSSHSSEKDENSDDDDNVKKEKIKKNVKVGKVKKENECRRKLSEVSPPRLRKMLHKMMTKYNNDPFYETNDIAKKILNKLKVSTTQHFMRRIKKNMDKWIRDNVIDNDIDEDSSDESHNKESKGVKRARNNNKPSDQEDLLESEAAKEKKDVRASDQFQSSRVNQKSMKLEKEIPIIDLTLDLKKDVKKEVVTVIDEDAHDSRNKAVSTLVNTLPIQQMPYPLVPGYSPSVYHPSEFYQAHYQNYANPNLYNPYFFPYGCQYLHNPYFYNPSDFLPNYPVDETEINNPNVTNNATGLQSLDPKDADAVGSQTLEGSDIRQ